MNSELSYSSPTAGLISQCVVKFVELAADDRGLSSDNVSIFRQLHCSLHGWPAFNLGLSFVSFVLCPWNIARLLVNKLMCTIKT